MEGKTGQDTELLQRMQRDINCLLDQDRTTRRNALVALAQKCASPDTGVESGRFVYEQHLLKNLLHCVCDEVDFIREKAIKLNQDCIEKFSPISQDCVTRVVEVLLGRLNAIPYPETSEEVRLQIIVHLRVLLKKYKEVYRSCMGAVLDVLGKSLLDKYPEVKRETSELICEFCQTMPDHIALNGKNLVKALSANIKHQHAKIRRSTIVALTEVLTVPLGGQNFGDAEAAVKLALADKSSDVRKETYLLLASCLKKFTYPDLKSFETRMVKHLLSGYAEQSADIRAKIAEYLNECGESRKKLEEEMAALES